MAVIFSSNWNKDFHGWPATNWYLTHNLVTGTAAVPVTRLWVTAAPSMAVIFSSNWNRDFQKARYG
jgi:hypothetical protein